MPPNIQKWAIEHYESLRSQFEEDWETMLYVEAFLTQYELVAKYLIAQSKLQRLRTCLAAVKSRFTTKPKVITQEHHIGDSRNIDLLFWPWQLNHEEIIAPLLQELNQSSLKVNLFSHHPNFSADFKKKHEAIWLSPPKVHADLSYKKSRSFKLLYSASSSLSILKSDGKKVNFQAIVQKCFQWYYNLIHETITYFDTITTQNKVSSIFIGNDLTIIGRVIGLLAKKKGIKTISYMHGSIKSELWKYLIVDRFYVYGIVNKNLLLQRGVKEEQIVIAGSTKLELAKQTTPTNIIQRTPYKEAILVAFSGPGHSVTEAHHKQIVAVLENVITQFQDIRFIIKLHQKDRLKYYLKIEGAPNVSFVQFQDQQYSSDIFDWIKSVDLIITTASSSALEALAFNKPSLSIDTLHHLPEVPFIKAGACYYCHSQEEVIKQINKLRDTNFPIPAKGVNFREQYYHFPEEGVATFMVSNLEHYLSKHPSIGIK